MRGPQVTRPSTARATAEPAAGCATGDLAPLDADGNVCIVDRLKELIKVGAFQVAPAELEALLPAHPMSPTRPSCRADDRTGEVPVARRARGRLDPRVMWVAASASPPTSA